MEQRLQTALDGVKANYDAKIEDLKTKYESKMEELNAAGKAEMRDDPEGDRPGWWSNAKAGLYGAVGSTALLAGADQFIPGVPHAVIDLIVGGVTIAATAVPARREGWRKKKHGD